jgi:hypothetical protein
MKSKLFSTSKIMGLIVAVAFGVSSCNDSSSNDPLIDGAQSKSGVVAGNYAVEASSVDGYNFTLTIDQSNAQDISHLIVEMVDCNGNYLTIENYVSAKVNNIEWPLVSTTGDGTDCTFGNDFVKFDNFSFNGGIVTVEFTVDVQAAEGRFLIKSARNCYEYGITGYCQDCTIKPSYYDIFAGQSTLVGQLVVTNDNEYLYVTYKAMAGQLFKETHLYVGSISGLPINKAKTPVPGQFPYKNSHSGGVAEFTYTIPLAGLGENVIIAAHGAMINGETSWSYGMKFPGTTRWGWYSEYTTQFCK